MAHSSLHSTNNRRAVLGAVYAFLAAVGFSGKAILVKLAYGYSVDAVTLLALRMLFSLPFFITIAVWSARNASAVNLTARDWLSVVTLGLLGYYLSSLLDFLGLAYIPASLERLILFLYPTMVVILSALFLARRITGSVVVALALSYTGIALVFASDASLGQRNVAIGASLVFASTLTYAIYLVGSGQVIAKLGPARFTGYALTVSCVAVVLHFGIVNAPAALIQPLPVYGMALAMALFSTVLPALLLAEGMRRIGADKTSIIGSIGPVATILLAYLFLGESLSVIQMAGAALVLAGVLFISLRKGS
ncbi:MAG: DMT family transporter [Gammaproteobacteria bacterium]|nr:DMT family transporter [Gammaproteobacteria bacterium]